jgi:hypothetical protein
MVFKRKNQGNWKWQGPKSSELVHLGMVLIKKITIAI